jgi:hypothetical protein
MHATKLEARKKFDALFSQKQPTREEMFMRPDFRVLAAMVGMNFGQCWDALVNKASATKYGGNILLAAEDWYGEVSAPRF